MSAHSINSSRTASCPTALVERLLPSESFPESGADAGPHDSGTGTRRSSFFLLFNSAVGSGMLAMPSLFLAGGLLGGTLLLLVFVAVEVATALQLRPSASLSASSCLNSSCDPMRLGLSRRSVPPPPPRL